MRGTICQGQWTKLGDYKRLLLLLLLLLCDPTLC